MDMEVKISISFSRCPLSNESESYMKDSVFYVEESAYHEVTVSWSLSFRINKIRLINLTVFVFKIIAF